MSLIPRSGIQKWYLFPSYGKTKVAYSIEVGSVKPAARQGRYYCRFQTRISRYSRYTRSQRLRLEMQGHQESRTGTATVNCKLNMVPSRLLYTHIPM